MQTWLVSGIITLKLIKELLQAKTLSLLETTLDFVVTNNELFHNYAIASEIYILRVEDLRYKKPLYALSTINDRLNFWRRSDSLKQNYIFDDILNSLNPKRYVSNHKSLFSDHKLRIKIMSTSYYIALRWLPQNTFDDK